MIPQTVDFVNTKSYIYQDCASTVIDENTTNIRDLYIDKSMYIDEFHHIK